LRFGFLDQFGHCWGWGVGAGGRILLEKLRLLLGSLGRRDGRFLLAIAVGALTTGDDGEREAKGHRQWVARARFD
jgi:hypothetical protein